MHEFPHAFPLQQYLQHPCATSKEASEVPFRQLFGTQCSSSFGVSSSNEIEGLESSSCFFISSAKDATGNMLSANIIIRKYLIVFSLLARDYRTLLFIAN